MNESIVQFKIIKQTDSLNVIKGMPIVRVTPEELKKLYPELLGSVTQTP